MMDNAITNELTNTDEVELAPVIHSYWKYWGYNNKDGFVYHCPLCHRHVGLQNYHLLGKEFPYCHCGAKMDLKEPRKENSYE